MASENKYITLAEAAAILGTATLSLRKLMKAKVIVPEFKLGANYAFDREKIEEFKAKEFSRYYRFRNQENLRFNLHPPTEEELNLLNKDLANELDRAKYAKENRITRQRLQGKIYSIAYRKMYFDQQLKKENP